MLGMAGHNSDQNLMGPMTNFVHLLTPVLIARGCRAPPAIGAAWCLASSESRVLCSRIRREAPSRHSPTRCRLSVEKIRSAPPPAGRLRLGGKLTRTAAVSFAKVEQLLQLATLVAARHRRTVQRMLRGGKISFQTRVLRQMTKGAGLALATYRVGSEGGLARCGRTSRRLRLCANKLVCRVRSF
jgi:hypothetical protein